MKFYNEKTTANSRSLYRPAISALLRYSTVLALALAFLILTNSLDAHAQTSSAYRPQQVQTMQSVQRAVVLQARNVTIDAPVSAQFVGGATGASLGYLIAQHVGAGNGQIAARIIGSTAGGVVGANVGARIAKTPAQELILRTERGAIVAVTQALDGYVRFEPNQPVMIVGQGRVIPDLSTPREER
jgi:outer membrane lipoprotein SlyB